MQSPDFAGVRPIPAPGAFEILPAAHGFRER